MSASNAMSSPCSGTRTAGRCGSRSTCGPTKTSETTPRPSSARSRTGACPATAHGPRTRSCFSAAGSPTACLPDQNVNDYNTQIIEEFRANEGRVGGPWEGTPLVLVHHIGAKSGIERVTPLGCFPQGDGRFVIVASNGGSATDPDWYNNLKANPRTEVEVGAETFTVVAEEL